MANQDYDKPGNAYDDNWKTSGFSQNSDSDDTKSASQESLKNAEESADSSAESTSSEASAEEAAKVGKGFSEKDEPDTDLRSRVKDKFKFTRRKSIATILVTLGLGGGFMGFSVLQGPAELVHIAQILQKAHFSHQEDASDGRMGKLYRYMTKDNSPGETRLSYLESKYNDRLVSQMNEKGFSPDFDKTTGELKGFTIDTTERQSPFYGQSSEEIKTTLTSQGIPAETLDSGKIYSEAKGYRNQTKASKFFIKQLGKSKLSNAVRVRVFKKYGWVTWHPLQKLDKKLNQSVLDRYKAWKDAREERLKNGVKGTTIDASGAVEENPDGSKTPVNETADVGDSSKIKDILGQVHSSGTLKVTGGVAAASGLVCAAKAVNDNIGDIRYFQIIKPLMRMGSDAVTVGNQVMSGKDVDMETASFVAKSLRDSKSGTSWTQAESIRSELGESGGVPMDAATKDLITEGSPSWLSWTNSGAIGALCSTFGQVATGVVSVTLGILSGGAISTASSVVAGEIGGKFVIDKLSSLLSGEAVNVAASGAAWGNDINFGSRLFGNAMALSSGGVKLSTAQVSVLDADTESADRQDFASRNFIARAFDPYDQRSLAGKTIDTIPTISSYSDVASIAQSLPTTFMKALKSPASLFTKKTQAASLYDYGFEEVGFSKDDLGDNSVSDPYQNAELAAKILDKNGQSGTPDYISRAQKCFGINIQKDSNGKWETVAADNVDEVYKKIYDKTSDYDSQGCIDKTNQDWLRVRFFIFDSGLMDGWACYEDDEEACTNVSSGDSSEAPESTTPVSSGSVPTGSAKDLAQQLKQYVDQGKVKCLSSGCPDIVKTANGQSIKGGQGCLVDALDPQLLGMLIKLVQMNHTFILSALCSDHHNDGPNGHAGGKAADFNTIDGVFMGPNDVPWTGQKITAGKKLDQDAASFMPKNTGFGQMQCHPQFSFLSGFETFNDACHHQHIEVDQ
jgi:hypothetical protein